MNNLVVSYDDIKNLVEVIFDKINNIYKPDIIIGVGTGGWLPAKLLNNYFNVEIDSINLRSYEGKERGEIKCSNLNNLNLDYLKNKKILVIDDVNDSGSTLKHILEMLSPLTSNLYLCVLHDKKKEKVIDLFLDNRCIYVYATFIDDVWINYPWDH